MCRRGCVSGASFGQSGLHAARRRRSLPSSGARVNVHTGRSLDISFFAPFDPYQVCVIAGCERETTPAAVPLWQQGLQVSFFLGRLAGAIWTVNSPSCPCRTLTAGKKKKAVEA